MPLDNDEFETLPRKRGPPAGAAVHRVLRFLRVNGTHAFTAGEIAAATELRGEDVRLALARLRARERVTHRGDYWRVNESGER